MRKTILFIVVLFLSVWASAQESRHFTFHYGFSVRNVKPGQKLRVWIPLAHSDDFQEVKVVAMTGDLPLKETREGKYGNTMLYAHAAQATKPEYKFAVDYNVVRRERVALPREGVQPHMITASWFETRRYLHADNLVPTTGKLAEIARQQVKGHTGTMDRARALYDYVFTTMRYDKSGTGWGRGDAEWACESRHGNCTDFHSVFISLARSQHIPARFEIGFPLPASKHAGEIAGYHCWAEFYDAQYGWVPVDISEAWKDKSKKDYFFGAHDVNRVQFTMGRDIVLHPAQKGGARNYFVYPYVEVEGGEYLDVATGFSFADVGTVTATATAVLKKTP